MPDRRDSEAPRDEPQPLTAERLAEIRRAVDRVFRESERLDELVSHEYYLLADLLSHVQRLEAENAALWDVLNEDGWDCSADPGHEHLAAKLEALRAKRLTP